MEELVKYMVESLVADKEAVTVSSVDESEKVTIINVLVDKNDIGKVIGRNGKIAASIRTIVKSASAKLNKKYIIKIGERD